MSIFTVAALKRYLEAEGLSVEEFAEELHISHMTIYRLLRKDPATPIPTRYMDSFNKHYSQAYMRAIVKKVRAQGKDRFTGGNVNNQAYREVLEELGSSTSDVDWIFTELDRIKTAYKFSDMYLFHIKVVSDFARDQKLSPQHRNVALGALIVLVRIFDYISPTNPVSGFVEAMGSMTVAIWTITRQNAMMPPETTELKAA